MIFEDRVRGQDGGVIGIFVALGNGKQALPHQG